MNKTLIALLTSAALTAGVAHAQTPAPMEPTPAAASSAAPAPMAKKTVKKAKKSHKAVKKHKKAAATS